MQKLRTRREISDTFKSSYFSDILEQISVGPRAISHRQMQAIFFSGYESPITLNDLLHSHCAFISREAMLVFHILPLSVARGALRAPSKSFA